MSKPKRSRSLHGAGADALTPDFSDRDYAEVPARVVKGAVLFYIESLQTRIRAQQAIIKDQQNHIDKLRRIFMEMGPLRPEHNPRPSKGRASDN